MAPLLHSTRAAPLRLYPLWQVKLTLPPPVMLTPGAVAKAPPSFVEYGTWRLAHGAERRSRFGNSEHDQWRRAILSLGTPPPQTKIRGPAPPQIEGQGPVVKGRSGQESGERG